MFQRIVRCVNYVLIMIHFSSYMSTWDWYWLYHIKSSINQVVKDAPSPMLKKVASVPSRLYSKVWQEYWVISNVLHCRYCLTCNTQLCFSHASSSLVCLLPPPWFYYLGAVLQIFLWTPLCYSAVDTCLKKVTSFSTSFSVSIICWLFVDLFVIIS